MAIAVNNINEMIVPCRLVVDVILLPEGTAVHLQEGGWAVIGIVTRLYCAIYP
jgi:hypothetical protein